MNANEYRVILIRQLHAAGKAAGLDHDALHDLAQDNYGKGVGELNIPQLRFLLLHFNGKQDQKPELSSRQKAIYAIGYRSLQWDAQRIRDFISQQIGCRKSVQQLSASEASKVIAGMEAVEKWRKEKGTGG